MAEGLRIVRILIVLGLATLALDYGCYYQATIFTDLAGSRKEIGPDFRDPPYHPFVRPILWAIAAIGVIPVFLMVAFNISDQFSSYIVAGAVGAFFVARWILMRRGIS